MMFHEFMSMGLPAALAILALVTAPGFLILVIGTNRNARRGQEIEYDLKKQEKAHQARLIELKKNPTDQAAS